MIIKVVQYSKNALSKLTIMKWGSSLTITAVTISILLQAATGDPTECEAGRTYREALVGPVYAISGWYLNINLPLSCSGNISEIELKFFEPLFPGNYCVYWAIWEPKNGTRYERVNGPVGSIKRVCIYFPNGNDDPELQSITVQIPSNERYPVKKGSIIGGFLKVSIVRPPLLVIGRARSLNTPDQGVCRVMSRVNENTQSLTCSTNHYIADQMLNMEAVVDVIDCQFLYPPSNGYLKTEPTSSTQYGAVVHYVCHAGYTLEGPQNRTCQSNGTWSSYGPSCVKTSTLCSSSSSSVCIDGVCESQSSSTCNCTDPGVPKNGYRSGDVFSIGSTVMFTCNNGYQLAGGSQTIVCIQNDTLNSSSPIWNSSVPTCTLNSTKSETTLINNVGLTVPTTINTVALTTTTTTLIHSTISHTVLTSSGTTTLRHTLNHSTSTHTVLHSTYSTTNTISLSSTTTEDHSTKTSHITSRSRRPPSPVRTVVLASEHQPLIGFSTHVMIAIVTCIIVICILCAMLGTIIVMVLIRRKKIRRRRKSKEENGNNGLDNPTSYTVVQNNEKVNVNPSNFTVAEPVYETNSYQVQSHIYDEPSPYEAPARGKRDLYVQLDRIKVKRLLAKDIKLQGRLGQGQFGSVHKAIWKGVPVAVKTLIEEATDISRIKFLQEAAIMGQFSHPNVIKLHGVVTDGDNIMLVVELMSKGDLSKYLREKRLSNEIKTSSLARTLHCFCQQISSGMDYLSKRGYVHRDLAARNILLTDNNQCKIADFGMSRDVEQEGYYVAQRGTKIPVKWTAPEALKYRKYSTASDVWSYGCVLYEIWSLGHKPFEKYNNTNILPKIDKGYRLPPPPGCPYAIYKLMIMCWHPDSNQRPSFCDILNYLIEQNNDHIPNNDSTSSESVLVNNCGRLGAALEEGEKLYKELQNTYMYYFTLENVQ